MRVAIGVDFKLREVSMAALITEDEGAVRLVAATKTVDKGLPLPTTLRRLGGRTEALIDLLKARGGFDHANIEICMVEEPGGFRSNQIIMAQGIIMAALDGMGLTVVSYPISSWRKRVLGKGNWKTEEAKAAAVQFIEESFGMTLSEDESEAACIALCASMEVKR